MRFPSGDEQAPADSVAESLDVLGLVAAGGELPLEDEFYLWPGNVAVWDLWMAVQSQWRTDYGTRTGLDYPGVQVCINNRPIGKKDRPEYFQMLQAMEAAALNEWSNKR